MQSKSWYVEYGVVTTEKDVGLGFFKHAMSSHEARIVPAVHTRRTLVRSSARSRSQEDVSAHLEVNRKPVAAEASRNFLPESKTNSTQGRLICSKKETFVYVCHMSTYRFYISNVCTHSITCALWSVATWLRRLCSHFRMYVLVDTVTLFMWC